MPEFYMYRKNNNILSIFHRTHADAVLLDPSPLQKAKIQTLGRRICKHFCVVRGNKVSAHVSSATVTSLAPADVDTFEGAKLQVRAEFLRTKKTNPLHVVRSQKGGEKAPSNL
ncbi:hypothetical protein B0H13DRAFT_1869041 [Mycena leptocephala]|nr:hypothetical protein B0H13DRAFT_1869041 [Mycena leptocephala]